MNLAFFVLSLSRITKYQALPFETIIHRIFYCNTERKHFQFVQNTNIFQDWDSLKVLQFVLFLQYTLVIARDMRTALQIYDTFLHKSPQSQFTVQSYFNLNLDGCQGLMINFHIYLCHLPRYARKWSFIEIPLKNKRAKILIQYFVLMLFMVVKDPWVLMLYFMNCTSALNRIKLKNNIVYIYMIYSITKDENVPSRLSP